jgi:8-oxo-dGTP diphosphatase
MKSIKVVCGIIWKDDKVLIAKRKPEKSLGGYWEFPGGKVEQNEDPIDSLKRELLEELGLEISNIYYFGQNIHEYETFSIELIAFECVFEKATFELKDHDDVAFVNTESIKAYNLAPADIFFVNRLINK